MSDEVQFEEDFNSDEYSDSHYEPEIESFSKFSRFLLDHNIARNSKQADYMLLIIVGLFLLLALFITIRSLGSSSSSDIPSANEIPTEVFEQLPKELQDKILQ
jgi:hypothetical protein